MSLPRSPDVDHSPDLSHPWWCSPTACSAADEPDPSRLVAALASGHHRGQSLAVAAQRPGDLAIGVQIASWAAEPVDTAQPVAEVTISRGDTYSVEGYGLDGQQVRELVVRLAGLLPAFDSGPVRRLDAGNDCPPWCARSHTAAWVGHVRTTGEVVLGDLALVAQAARYCGDRPAVVELAYHDGTRSRVTNLPPGQARELGLALLAAAGLAEDCPQ